MSGHPGLFLTQVLGRWKPTGPQIFLCSCCKRCKQLGTAAMMSQPAQGRKMRLFKQAIPNNMHHFRTCGLLIVVLSSFSLQLSMNGLKQASGVDRSSRGFLVAWDPGSHILPLTLPKLELISASSTVELFTDFHKQSVL